MNFFKIFILLLVNTIIFAGGDYGGGPQVVALHRSDTHVHFSDIKLSRDKELVELDFSYRKVRMKTNPLLTEEEEKKLRRGKFTTLIMRYDKDLFDQDSLDMLEKRKKFVIFRKKYKKLAQKLFKVEKLNSYNKGVNTVHYEIRLK